MSQYGLPGKKQRVELKNPPVAPVAAPAAVPTGRTTLTPELLQVIEQIESGGNPNARTGSYKGLYQLSDSEFARLGGVGDIFNPAENKRIATLKLQQEADQVAAKLGRPLTPGEIYLVHQQGVGGSYAHITNPDRPAWQSMYATGEGRKKGEKWSRLAISGNIPDREKARYGDVNSITSRDFARMWSDRVARGTGKAPPMTVADAASAPDPTTDPAGNTSGGETAAAVASSGGGIGSDAAASARVAAAEPEKKTKDPDYREIAGDAFKDFGKLWAEGPVARNAARPSGPANVPMPSMPIPQGPQPIVDPRVAEAQRQQLAMAMKRLNSGRLS